MIFKNISRPKKRDSWDESKDILTMEIKSVMPTVEETVVATSEKGHIYTTFGLKK